MTKPFLTLLFVFGSFFAGQQASPPKSTGPDVVITIKVLNGKNGRPVWRESPNVYVGDSTGNVNPRTDRHGETKLPIPADAVSIRITPNWGHECRLSNGSYSIAEILTKGVVAENSCGASKAKSTPGVLVLYERPSSWWERTWE